MRTILILGIAVSVWDDFPGCQRLEPNIVINIKYMEVCVLNRIIKKKHFFKVFQFFDMHLCMKIPWESAIMGMLKPGIQYHGLKTEIFLKETFFSALWWLI